MDLLIRTLLIWLLVLAVPAQGVAAATMAFCSPDHHGSGTAAQAQTAAPVDHAHHGGDMSAHGHPQAVAAADKGAPATSATSAPADPADPAASAKANHAGEHKCSACASCCSVGAILSSVLAVPAPMFTPTVFSTVVLSVDAFAADGPDRPPRIVLA